MRSFEALRQLKTAGLSNAVNLQGGLAALQRKNFSRRFARLNLDNQAIHEHNFIQIM